MAKARTPAHGVVDAAEQIASHLDALGARYALVGGIAVGARAEPRYTRDVDVAVCVESDEEAEGLVHGLTRRGYTVEALVEQKRTKRLATARLRHRVAPEIFVDLLFASSGIERECVDAAESIAYRPGTKLPVARLAHLIAMKVLSEDEQRLQDRIDLELLAGHATDADWAKAEAALRLIRARGYHRGRALVRRLRAWRRRSSGR